MMLALLFVALTGPSNQMIYVSADEVISIRAPRSSDHLSKHVHCLIHTSDGKFIAVVEDCKTVKQRLEQ
jgi:hypothetical protein